MKPTRLLIMGILSASCATKDADQAETSAEVSGADPAYVLEALDAAALPRGECGMILWTLDDDRPSPIFRYVAGKSGEIKFNGATIALTRSETSGASGFGVFERQVFRGEDGIAVRVDMRFSLGFDGGSYLERAIVAVESPGGWRSVSPAAGIAGCRAS